MTMIYAHCDRAGRVTFHDTADVKNLICLGAGPTAC